MAQGESRYDPNNRQVTTNEFRTAPTNDYILKAKAGTFMVGCKQEEGAIPYVHGRAEILGTEDDKGRNISMILPFYLTLTPRKEDGKPAVDLAGGLTDLCQKLKVNVPEDVKILTFAGTDERGQVEALSSKAVKEFLNNLGEFTVKAHVRKKPAKDGWPAKNVVEFFIDDSENKAG